MSETVFRCDRMPIIVVIFGFPTTDDYVSIILRLKPSYMKQNAIAVINNDGAETQLEIKLNGLSK